MTSPLSPQQASSMNTHRERAVFALAPRLDGFWRGFYLGYFSSHAPALHARTDPMP